MYHFRVGGAGSASTLRHASTRRRAGTRRHSRLASPTAIRGVAISTGARAPHHCLCGASRCRLDNGPYTHVATDAHGLISPDLTEAWATHAQGACRRAHGRAGGGRNTHGLTAVALRRREHEQTRCASLRAGRILCSSRRLPPRFHVLDVASSGWPAAPPPDPLRAFLREADSLACVARATTESVTPTRRGRGGCV